MTLLIVHFAILTGISYAISTRLTTGLIDRLIATAALFWAHVISLCLLLSCIGKLGEVEWFFRTSLLAGLASVYLVRRFVSPPPDLPVSAEVYKVSWTLLIAVIGSLFVILLVNTQVAAAYPPNNYDSLAYHLPRVTYYLGHGTLAQFESADIRQTFFTFNYNLLQLFCFIYSPPHEVINFINVVAWAVAGLGIYRVSRLCGGSINASLIATWITLTATEVLAQAATTTLDLSTAAALFAAVLFGLRWRQDRLTRHALLAGIAAGIAGGAKLTVVFFGPTVVLLLSIFLWQDWRRGAVESFWANFRAWIVPGIVALVLAIPFIIYNIAATGHWMTDKLDFTLNKPFSFGVFWQTSKAYLFQLFFEPFGRFTADTAHISHLNEWFSRTFFKNWNEAYAYSGFYVIPPDLNEDHVWYGFAGPLLLICSLICLSRDRRLQTPIAWIALLSIGWLVTYFAMNKWSLYIQRYFLIAIVLMGPCVAVFWDRSWTGSKVWGSLKRLGVYLVAATSLWFAIVYLTENRNRPFLMLSSTARAPQVLPDVPTLLSERLSQQRNINVISDGTNERIYVLMHFAKHQRFTSSRQVAPEKYNLFSYWGFTRNNIYSNIAHIASHTVVSVPTKKTAGVEFLGTVGVDVNAFDYVGLVPNANETESKPENRNIVVLVEYAPTDPDRFAKSRLRVEGLNPADEARVEINAEMTDSTVEKLMSQTHSGYADFSLKAPFKRLAIKVVDSATNKIIGLGDFPLSVKPSVMDVLPPVSATTLFRTELITSGSARNLSVNGLADLEGPYAQWDLPSFRWAKQPNVRIEIPANSKLKRIKLSFDVRLQMREQARLSVLHNGTVVGDYWLNGSTNWHKEELFITPSIGENVIELRDQPRDKVPDWLGYLELYPDVKEVVRSAGQDPEEGAREHYLTHGRNERRTLPTRSRTFDEVPDWDAYLKQNDDVREFAKTKTAPLEETARWHYENHGGQENRTLPMKVQPIVNTPPPESLYFIYRSLQIEGFSAP